MDIDNSKRFPDRTDASRNGRLVRGLQMVLATTWAMLGVLYIVKGSPVGWVATVASLAAVFSLGASEVREQKLAPALIVIFALGVLAALMMVGDIAIGMSGVR